YNLKMVSESMAVFDTYLRRKKKEQEETMKDVEDLGLSYRQSQILKDMIRNGEPVSQYELSAKYQTPVPTVRSDLIKLIELGLVKTSGKNGHRILYVYNQKK
ncbi:MAG: hypothetical protein J5897_01770, partial [Candidatus Methanomethylophilus sp.]|nr:hypothetical protein [Methanomethylophilus sp.]